MKKIVLFGGSFNPVTNAHIQNAKLVLNTGLFDEIWITPCYKHMHGKSLTACKHRSAMISLAIATEKKIKLFNYECRYKLPGSTFHFITTLSEDLCYNDNQYYLLIGQDNANNIETWHRYKDLIEKIPFVVVGRLGYSPPEDPWYAKKPHIDLTQQLSYSLSGSSTQVREAIKEENWEEVARLVNPKVQLYLELTPLY